MLSKGAFRNHDKADRVFALVRLLNDSVNETMRNFKDNLINYHISAEQIYRLKIKQIDKVYLKNFQNYYEKLFQNLIEKFVQRHPESRYPMPYQDALYNYHFIKANSFKELSSSSDCVLKTLRDYIFDESTNQPFILHGAIGSGKTTYISALASNLYLHFIAHDKSIQTSENIVVLRFIGIDGKSIYLRNLLKSLCLQLNLVCNENAAVPENLIELKECFRNFLMKNTSPSSRLVVILDSLQDLSETDKAHKLDWLPKHLGANCKLILTVASDSVNLMRRLRRKYTETNSYVELSHIKLDQAKFMIQRLLSQQNYRLEAEQYNLIMNLISKKPVCPLHLKILSGEFLNWKSYTNLSECILKDTLTGSVVYFVNCLESKYGKKLVKHILSEFNFIQPN